jgi:hypothetical protein
MSKVDVEAIREAWLRNMAAEARLWLVHIDKRTQEILDTYAEKRVPLFETGELLFDVFSYLNWLAHVHFREEKYVRESDHPRGQDIISFLQEVTNWPRDACEAFWYCVRNPVLHTGRTSLFSDYDRKSSGGRKLFADLHPNLTFDPARFQPEEFKPTVEEDGYLALPDPDSPDQLEVWFYFPGIRRKLDEAQTIVLQGIATADDQSVLGLRRINMKTLAFRIAAVSD